jgi:hypothetical protein
MSHEDVVVGRKSGGGQGTVNVLTTSTALVPLAPLRRSLLISSPLLNRELYVSQNSLGDGVATDALAVVLTYTVPAGRTAKVTQTTLRLNSGAPSIDLELVQGGATIVIYRATADRIDQTGLRLEAGDVLQFRVVVAAIAGSTADLSIHVEEQQVQNRVSLVWGRAAVLDAGITLYPGYPPLLLTIEVDGGLVKGPIFAISAGAAQDLSFWESFYLEP